MGILLHANDRRSYYLHLQDVGDVPQSSLMLHHYVMFFDCMYFAKQPGDISFPPNCTFSVITMTKSRLIIGRISNSTSFSCFKIGCVDRFYINTVFIPKWKWYGACSGDGLLVHLSRLKVHISVEVWLFIEQLCLHFAIEIQKGCCVVALMMRLPSFENLPIIASVCNMH